MSQKIFMTSDTHFRHNNILKYEAASRPFKDRDEMDSALIGRWNSVVGEDDVVFHLGDFAFAGKTYIQEVVSKLNGSIYLLLGNHDRGNGLDWESLGFVHAFEKPFVLDGKFILTHEPMFPDEIPDGMVNIYGHVHGSPMFNTVDSNRFCVCVERHVLTPVPYDTILKTFGVASSASSDIGHLMASKVDFNVVRFDNRPLVETHKFERPNGGTCHDNG